MANSELEAQIAREQQEIENAPKVPIQSGMVGRCGWCGQVSQNLVYVETVNGLDRFKGLDCCGGRHA